MAIIVPSAERIEHVHGRAEADYNMTGDSVDSSYYAGVTDALSWVLGGSVPDEFEALLLRAKSE